MAKLNEEQTIERTDIIGGSNVSQVQHNVSITAGTAMVRGTLMTTADGKAAATVKGGVADCILAADVTTTDTVATVYVKGEFIRDLLTAASDDTVAAHEEELRKIGIFMVAQK